jgi:hypothetical protein
MRRTTLTLALMLICACGAANSANGQPAPATASPTAQAAASPDVLTCTASGAASALWPAALSASTSTPAIVSAVADGDTLKLTFVSGTPQFEVAPIASAHFTVDPSGRPVDLAGASGVRIVLRGFRGDMSNYNGAARFTSSGPILLEVGAVGDFEGVVGFGAGVSRPACANVTASSSTLTFHFIASGT